MDDNQQDANSALMELDKGLRAHKVGEQCEAIVRFTSVFTRFPFPILINSAFLKLADAFRTGNNFVRLCILRVAQQSTKHLDKILNVDEFMKRIYMVIHSNDPYARAITLRMLGSVSCIIGEKKNAHHCIRQGLDSHDRVEQDAAIFATIQFASHSHDFASGICNKIATILQGLSTPLEIKLKLIPVLQHMHYDVQISAKARSILQDLLPSYPTEDFVLTTLNTLTLLSTHTLVDIPAQVNLLLRYLRCDPREAIKSNSLTNLDLLATKAAHLWAVKDSAAMCEAFKLSTLSDSLKRKILRVLCTLTSSSSLVQLDVDQDSQLLELCRECCYGLDMIQAAYATRLFAALLPHARRVSRHHHELLREEVVNSVEAILLVVAPTSAHSAQDRRSLEIVLPVLRDLHRESVAVESRLVDVIFSILECADLPVCSETCAIFLETLAAMSMTSCAEDLLSPYKVKLRGLLTQTCQSEVSTKNRQKVAILLVTLMCICEHGGSASGASSFADRLVGRIDNSSLDHWTVYRIARQASRLGQHRVACRLLTTISDSVASEQYYFWLTGVAELSRAETAIAEGFGKRTASCASASRALSDAIHHYHAGVTVLMAAVTHTHGLTFQCEYARLRLDTLQVHAELLAACQLIRTCPPPAIASSNPAKLEDAGDAAARSASRNNDFILSRMKACANQFWAVDTGYSELHMTSFDSDPSTLATIDILQQCCSIMAYAIDALVLSLGKPGRRSANLPSDGFGSKPTVDDIYAKALKAAFVKIVKMVEDVTSTSESGSQQKLSHVQTNCLVECVATLLAVPHSFPRYFYQSLQTTNIKLAISPSQRSPNEPVAVEISQQMALKVEGVVQRCLNSQTLDGDDEPQAPPEVGHHADATATKRFREVERVRLRLSVQRQGQSKNAGSKSGTAEGGKLEQIVEPHNDYFSTQFLTHLPLIGIYNLLVETEVQDGDGVWWLTGPAETVVVKAIEDPSRALQQQQQQQASSSTATQQLRPVPART